VKTHIQSERMKIIAPETETAEVDLAEHVELGLQRAQKTLPCRFFYDDEGSRIFEEICELPEYYLTRAEHEVLRDRCDEIARSFGRKTLLVELGSGSSTKTRTLIEAFLDHHGRLRYAPVDISRGILEESAHALLDDYPGLEILAIAAEYDHGLEKLRSEEAIDRKLILWLGSSVGNFTRAEASEFLESVRDTMQASDRLLIGIDLRKDAKTLERAYDDDAGVTARFNKNILRRINRELGADFDVDEFAHRATFDPAKGRVEMHLESLKDQTVSISTLDMTVTLAEGETIHTENSYKYSRDEISALAESARLTVEKQWTDSADRFSLSVLAPACSE
jgi:L-histidine N-alpha-methyltransferase